MALDPRSPVIVGAGQYVHRASTVDDGVEPVALMVEAVGAAAADAGLAGVPRAVDSIRVVNLLSWRYGNPAWVLAQRLGIDAAELAYTTAGGNSPQALVNRTALDIAAGRVDLVVLVGGEAWRTRMRVKQAGTIVDWAKAPETAKPLTIGDELDMTHPAEATRGIYLPVQVYPLFESAIRAAAGTPPDEHIAEIAELWSRFSAVAASNPYAWTTEPMTPEQIATVTPSNRIVGLPYRKVMNANNDVDMAAAIIMCSAAAGRIAGDPPRTLGVSARRNGLPRARLRVQPLVVVGDTGDPRRRTPSPGVGRRGDRRHRHRRPVLVLPVGRPPRRRVTRPRRHVASSPAPAGSALRAGRGTTT